MRTALSMKQALALADCWEDVTTKAIFLVTNGREFLVESPEARQDREDDFDEAILRIWTEEDDAELYLELAHEVYGIDDVEMDVMKTTLGDLFKLKKPIVNNGIYDFNATVRADVCVLRNGEPIVLDTLWTSEVNPN